MNILPLVIAFLLIFGGAALTFLRGVKCFGIMETTFTSFHKTERELNNALAQRAYSKFKGYPIAKKEGEKSSTAPFRSRRTLSPPYENSKFNLFPLFEYQGEIKLHPLYESAAQLLRLMYQKNLFVLQGKNEKIEYALLDALLYQGRSNKEAAILADLFPKDPKLQKLFYKTLKGTTQRDEERGYPPMEDFFCIREKEPVISLPYASPLLLEALLGTEITEFIMEEEVKIWEGTGKHTPISKEQLRTYLLNHPGKSGTFAAIDPFLSDAKLTPIRETISAKDRRTGIAIRAEL